MNEAEFQKEEQLLSRERTLKEQIVESYKNKIAYEILSENPNLEVSVKKLPRKSFLKRFFSIF